MMMDDLPSNPLFVVNGGCSNDEIDCFDAGVREGRLIVSDQRIVLLRGKGDVVLMEEFAALKGVQHVGETISIARNPRRGETIVLTCESPDKAERIVRDLISVSRKHFMDIFPPRS
jgi:hypothetical protein